MKHPLVSMIQEIAQSLYDKKGFNIIALDLRGVSSMTDFFLIAEGSVDRHVQALYREAKEKVEELGLEILHIEGSQSGDWIVMDCGELLVHLFVPELREKYSLEHMWKEGKLVDLKLKTGNQS